MLRALVATSLLMMTGVLSQAPGAPGAPFAPRAFARDGKIMPYRLFVPDEAARRQPLPLVVWLHGASGMGTDNLGQITEGGNDIGSRLWVRPDIQAKYPSFVVAPQMPTTQIWGFPASEKLTPYAQLVVDLIDSLAKEFPIDRQRIYVLGQSMGGIGVWDLISKRPEIFAAAVPVCATANANRVAAAAGVKVWVFHGAKDTGMPVASARAAVAALQAAGGAIKYTEYADAGHEVWTRAFAEPELPAWLFAQRRTTSDCNHPFCF
ncbi:MAG TPA: prolyl oligopeptidase family serine peptidase [Vicinamibacterales bacterium]|nr:prolyl oligopeptidase family serine peptidase [Vicinamibacterales bacterium]